MSHRPKVVFCVLTGIERFHWINPGLAMRLLEVSRSPKFDVTVTCAMDRRPVDLARYYAVVRARDIW